MLIGVHAPRLHVLLHIRERKEHVIERYHAFLRARRGCDCEEGSQHGCNNLGCVFFSVVNRAAVVQPSLRTLRADEFDSLGVGRWVTAAGMVQREEWGCFWSFGLWGVLEFCFLSSGSGLQQRYPKGRRITYKFP